MKIRIYAINENTGREEIITWDGLDPSYRLNCSSHLSNQSWIEIIKIYINETHCNKYQNISNRVFKIFIFLFGLRLIVNPSLEVSVMPYLILDLSVLLIFFSYIDYVFRYEIEDYRNSILRKKLINLLDDISLGVFDITDKNGNISLNSNILILRFTVIRKHDTICIYICIIKYLYVKFQRKVKQVSQAFVIRFGKSI